MPEKLVARAAVMLVLSRQHEGRTEVLLQRRQNTGYADGMWDCGVCGHVDVNEGMRTALAREAREEMGITLSPADLIFLTQIFKYTPETGNTYFNSYFFAERYVGEPVIHEPHKCAEIAWFPLDNLPPDLIGDRRAALENWQKGIPYSEMGWEA